MIATFSLAAREPKTGILAIITASNYLAVGSLVAHIDSRAGLVVTQSFANPSAANLALNSLRSGKTPEEAIKDFLADDDLVALRQIGVMSLAGETALYSGVNCTQVVESFTGDNFIVLGNMLVAGTTQAIADTFNSARDNGLELGTAMIKAMLAGQKIGGDQRGKLAAALLMQSPHECGLNNTNFSVDLRVDAASEPLTELKDLYSLFKLYNPVHFQHQMLPIQQLSATQIELINKLLKQLSASSPTQGLITLEQPNEVAKLLTSHNLACNYDAQENLISSLLLSEASSFFRLSA